MRFVGAADLSKLLTGFIFSLRAPPCFAWVFLRLWLRLGLERGMSNRDSSNLVTKPAKLLFKTSAVFPGEMPVAQ